MATQQAWPEAASSPAKSWKSVATVVRTISDRAVTGQREVVELAMQQAKEQTDDFFVAMRTMAVAANPVDYASCYMRFLNEASRKQAEQLRSVRDILSRSSKAAWQPIIEASADTMPKSSETSDSLTLAATV